MSFKMMPSPSFAGTYVSMNISLEDYTDDELISAVERSRKSNRLLEVENYLIESYLQKNEPKYLVGLQNILEQANKIQQHLQQAALSSQMSIATASFGSATSLQSKRSFSTTSRIGSTEGKKRINLNTKIELLTKEKEVFSSTMRSFQKSSTIKRNNLKAELEEINLRIAETKEAKEIFEQTIVKDALDPLTQRIPAEKFIRYMEEWLKSADCIIEKLRLRTSTFRYKYIYLQNQLKQKEELGENLHAVDLDQMKIENQELIKKLEEKNFDLIDLKKKTGEANLLLSKHKILLQSQLKLLHDSNNVIKQKEQKIKALYSDTEMTEKEVLTSEGKLKNIIYLTNNYTVPDLTDYIKTKKQYFDMCRNIKIMNRRNTIQQSTLDALIKTMKRLTGKRTENEAWFSVRTRNKDDEDDEFDLMP